MEIKEISIKALHEYENNPRHNENAVEAVAASIREFGFKVPIVVDADNVIVAGHTRLLASKLLGLDKVPCVVADDLTPEQVKAFRVADNKTAELAEWNFELLESELAELEAMDFDMSQFGFDESDFEEEKNPYDIPASEKGSLNDKFIVPPFSVLDARAGYWQDRKKLWKERIQDNGEARAAVEVINDNFNFSGGDVSILDPVLCEIILKWFMPNDGANTFDCFAGDTVFGYVSAWQGNNFTGIELRQEQAEFNIKALQAHGLNGTYICDDGRNVLDHVEENSQDLFFSCPPYFDLDVYSDLENDASNQDTYEDFYKILDTAFTNAVKCLKNNRFAVVVCGDVRNKKTGEYYGFIEDIKSTFKRNGLCLYNEMVLLDVVGTAALRVQRYMATRKLAKVHQNVLVFYKGDTSEIKNNFAEIEFEQGEFDESSNL